MQQALLTGAHGFLGGHIFKYLSENYSVHTLGLNTGNNYVVDVGKEIPGLSGNYHLVVHAAGLAHNKLKFERDYINVNAEGTNRLCLALDALDYIPEKFVFISSIAVYGLQSGKMIAETSALNGKTAYAKSKIEAELILEKWCAERSVSLSILRLPLIAGSGAPGNFGAMVKAISAGRFFIPGKGDARKSVVLAEDVAKYIAENKCRSGIFHLTDGIHPSLNDLALAIAKNLDKKTPVHLSPVVCKMLAFAGDLLGKKMRFNTSVLNQLTSTLTFDDSKARLETAWNPHPVINQKFS